MNSENDLELIRKNILQFINEELIPIEQKEGLTPESRFSKSMLKDIWKRSHELGFYGITLPKKFGGRSLKEVCILKEDVARSDSVLAPHVLGDLGGPPRIGFLLHHATEEQMEEFFKPVIRAEKACCFALTEKEVGSDATRIRTTAVKSGSDYILNGRKHYITGSPFADFAIVMASTDPSKGAKGITAFLVDSNLPGYSLIQEDVPLSGQHIEGDIVLKDCKVPARCVLGEEGKGFYLGMNRINYNRLLHCPTMIGRAQRLTDLSISFAKQRNTSKGPIAGFQAIQHMLADMAMGLHACRSMTLATADMADRNEDIRRESAMCKVMVSETAFNIADKAVQIHGATGLTKGHPVEWGFRMLRMFRVFTGTSEILRNTIATGLLQ